eukprot:534682-Amphidinium_carterae.1
MDWKNSVCGLVEAGTGASLEAGIAFLFPEVIRCSVVNRRAVLMTILAKPMAVAGSAPWRSRASDA